MGRKERRRGVNRKAKERRGMRGKGNKEKGAGKKKREDEEEGNKEERGRKVGLGIVKGRSRVSVNEWLEGSAGRRRGEVEGEGKESEKVTTCSC